MKNNRKKAAKGDPLTSAEVQILSLLMDGATNKTVARKMRMSNRRAEHARKRIMVKADVRGAVQLGVWAERSGYLCGSQWAPRAAPRDLTEMTA